LLHTFETAFGAELVTRGSGKNCTHAGDGFCDTPADPSSNRASCPYTGTTTDAQGQLYTPDVTLFMSYFDDNCTNRFSTEEQSEMNTTLSSSRSYLLNQTSPDLSALDSAVFINPVAGDSTIIGGTLTNFVWHAIPRAKFYYFHLQSSTSSIVFADTLITDTTFAVQLAANKGYKYWVKGMSYGNTCGENAFYQTIKTSVIKATVTIVTPSCQGQTNGTIAVAPSNGVYPYKYQWSNGDTTQTISNLTPGVYYLTITDNAGQVATTSVIVTEPSLLSATINQIGINLNAYGNGGTPPYTYSWSNGANGQYNNNVPFGNYTVTVTDSKGCTVTESIVYSTIGEDNTSKVAMKIFPNPASASTAIQLQIDLNERTEGTVTMFNINGEILQQVKREFIIGANHLSLNIEPLAAGVYFVQFRSNNAVKTERISILK
jgi:hypothetical protein